MNPDMLKHRLAYLILIVELVLFCVLFLIAWPNRMNQRILILFTVLFYIGWGSVTHNKADHLTKRIFLEYVGVAGLAGLLLFLITL